MDKLHFPDISLKKNKHQELRNRRIGEVLFIICFRNRLHQTLGNDR